MKVKFGKKHIMLAALVVFLGVAVLVNWYYTKPEEKITPADSITSEDISNNAVNLGDAVYVNGKDAEKEYFADAKLSRDESYDKAVATLNGIIESSDVDEQSVKTAAASLNDLSSVRVAQVNIENLVKAKTGSNCVAVISDGSASIIVDKNVITSDVVLQIKEIVMDNANIESEKITIIAAK